jgi:hypothetical protein
LESLFTRSDGDSTEGTDIAKVAAPSEGDVAVRGEDVIRGVRIHPTDGFTAIHGDPGVGGICTDEFDLTWRWHGLKIAADVARRESEAADTRYHDLGEVLADASAFFEDFFDRCGVVGGLRVKEEVFIDTSVQVADGFQNGTFCRKGGASVVGKGWPDRNQWGSIGKLTGGACGTIAVTAHSIADGLPGGCAGGVDGFAPLHFNKAAGDDFELLMGAFDLEIDAGVAKVVGAFRALNWHGADGHFMPGTLLKGQGSWLQACGVVAHRDRAFIGVGGAMDDVVTHEELRNAVLYDGSRGRSSAR